MKHFKEKYRNKNEFIDDLNNPSSNFFIKEYIKIKDRKKKKMSMSKKITLRQILDKIESMDNSLNKRIDGLDARMDKLESRMDKLESRMDNIEKRLDYNNLKKLPTDKN